MTRPTTVLDARARRASLRRLQPRRARIRGRAPRAHWRAAGATEHFVQFYEDDAFLVEALAGYVGEAVETDGVGIVVATPHHRRLLRQRLLALGIDVDAAIAAGRYVSLDAEETLAQFMSDGALNAERFDAVVSTIISPAVERGRAVRVFGEMVALLWNSGMQSAAVQLEALWNRLGERLPFGLFCAYPIGTLGGEALAASLRDVCAAHAHVIPAESYTTLQDADERLRAIAVLQQKAQSLEDALTAERAARAAAEAALQARDEFLSVAAHELKTPLTALRGQVELLQRRLRRDGALEPERLSQALAVMESGTSKLTRLLGQLFDVTRLQAGRLAIEPCEADLVDIARHVVAAASASDERQTIRLWAPESLRATVDALRIEQVLTNLVDNAIKYSDGGAIDVSLRSGDEHVEITVQDQGPGIPPEQRERIFDRFYQMRPDGRLDGSRGGLGLGLYICRQIVTQHGGNIEVECPPQGGARFTVRIPLAVGAAQPPAVAERD